MSTRRARSAAAWAAQKAALPAPTTTTSNRSGTGSALRRDVERRAGERDVLHEVDALGVARLTWLHLPVAVAGVGDGREHQRERERGGPAQRPDLERQRADDHRPAGE